MTCDLYPLPSCSRTAVELEGVLVGGGDYLLDRLTLLLYREPLPPAQWPTLVGKLTAQVLTKLRFASDPSAHS